MSGRDIRGRPGLPEPVAEHFRQVGRLEPPADLMNEVIGQIEAAERPHRFSWLYQGVLVAGATAVVVAVAVGVVSLLPPGPPSIGPPTSGSAKPAGPTPAPTPIELSLGSRGAPPSPRSGSATTARTRSAAT